MLPTLLSKKLHIFFGISYIVFEIFPFKLKNFPKMAIFGHFKKIKISIANCEKTKKDIQKPICNFVKHYLKSVLSKFEPKWVKTLKDGSFCPGAFFETFLPATGALWHFSKKNLKTFLSFIKGFQNIWANCKKVVPRAVSKIDFSKYFYSPK